MFHVPHNAFTAPTYPIHISSNHISQSRRRSAYIDNHFLRHTFGNDLISARTAVADPAEQARERLLLAIEEQKAARKAYADLLAQRELARLEAAAAQPGLATPDSHEIFGSDNFDLEYGTLLQRQQQRAALQQQQREQAILRKRQEELVHAQHQRIVEETASHREQQLEAARLQQLAVIRQQKLDALRQQNLQALRQQQIQAIRQQQVAAVRRRQEAEQQHRQQLVDTARRQQQIEEARRQHQLRHREEATRRQVEQQQESSGDEISQAIALAVAIAQQFFSNEPKESDELPKPPSAPAPAEPITRRVRFAASSDAAPAAAPIHSSSKPARYPVNKPTAAQAAASSTPPTPIRIGARDAKGKATTHVRVNSSPAPASSPPAATTTPADAIAALSILESDLDGYLAPEHEWQSEAHRGHALNQLLEQVDSVESGGEEAVREVRRRLVRRVERTLEALPEEETVKSKGVTINESKAEVAPVATTSAAAPTIASDVASEIEGYDVPDFLEATPAASSSAAEHFLAAPVASILASDAALPGTISYSDDQSEWSTVDPTVSTASAPAIAFVDEDVFPVPEVTTNAPQLGVGEPVSADAPQLDLGEPASIQFSEDSTNGTNDTGITAFDVVDWAPSQVETTTTAPSGAKHDSLSDWETTGSDFEQ